MPRDVSYRERAQTALEERARDPDVETDAFRRPKGGGLSPRRDGRFSSRLRPRPPKNTRRASGSILRLPARAGCARELATRAHEKLDSWIYRHREGLKATLRVAFGLIWGVDGAFKFGPDVVANFPGMVQDAGAGQPAWLGGWFSFWASQASQHAALWVYTTGFLELALAFALVFGFLRKIAYGGGILLSLLIWAVPEGFGGPYGPSSTDVGTGVVYAIAFLFLMIINATYGPSRYSLDRSIERRWPVWARLAEIRGPWTAARAEGSETRA